MHWKARLCNGEIYDERARPYGWTPEFKISPWSGLKLKCGDENLYVLGMELFANGGNSITIPQDKDGYWHMRAMHGVQGLQQAFSMCAVGWVNETNVYSVWTDGSAFWNEIRPLKKDQVIWKSGR